MALEIKCSGFKLFDQDSKKRNHPLFINKRQIVPVGIWLPAEYHPTPGFSPRGGWHLAMHVPDAPWLKSFNGTKTGYYKSRFKKGKKIWYRCEYNATINYTDEVQTLEGKCFKDHVPENGYYFFREAGKGIWVITSHIRLIEEVCEEERQEIMKAYGYNEADAFAEYNDRLAKMVLKEKYYDWLA